MSNNKQECNNNKINEKVNQKCTQISSAIEQAIQRVLQEFPSSLKISEYNVDSQPFIETDTQETIDHYEIIIKGTVNDIIFDTTDGYFNIGSTDKTNVYDIYNCLATYYILPILNGFNSYEEESENKYEKEMSLEYSSLY